MNYFYDRALRQFVDASGSLRTLRSLRFMRDEDREMAIHIQDNGVAWTSTGTTELTFGIKAIPGETSTTLAIIEPVDFSESSDIYTGTLELNGESLSDLLGSNFSLKLFSQLVITDDGGTHKSDIIPVIMGNDIIRGNEGDPTSLPDPNQYVIDRITNTNVNTAIATNPSATRTAAGLEIGSDVAAQGDVRIEPQVKSSSFTAANGVTYHLVASATVTDPSPVEGKGFTIFVRNGTTTVGGIAYSTAGTVIIRTFHSGAWANNVYQNKTASDAAYDPAGSADAAVNGVTFFDDFEDTKAHPPGSRLLNGDLPITGNAYRLSVTSSPSFPADAPQVGNGLIAAPSDKLFYLGSVFENKDGRFTLGFRFNLETTQFPAAITDGGANVSFSKDEMIPVGGGSINPVDVVHCNFNSIGVNQLDYYDTAITFQGNAAADTLTTASAHGLSTGWPLAIGGTGIPTGLSATVYYAIRVSDTVIRVASSYANAIAGTYINLTTDGTAAPTLQHAFIPLNRVLTNVGYQFLPPILEVLTFQAVSATDVITSSPGSFRTGDNIMFEGSGLPAPLVANTEYFANVVGGVMKVSTTLENALANVVIDLTTNGSAAQSVVGYVTPSSGRQIANDQEHLILFRVDGEYLEVELVGVGAIKFWSPQLPNRISSTTHFWWETGGAANTKRRARLMQIFADSPKHEERLSRQSTELAGRISTSSAWQMPGFEVNNNPRGRVTTGATPPSGTVGRLFGTGAMTVNGATRSTGANMLSDGAYFSNIGATDTGAHSFAAAAMARDFNFVSLLSSTAGAETSLFTVGLNKMFIAGEYEQYIIPIQLVGAGTKAIKLRRSPNNDNFVDSGSTLNGVVGFGTIRLFRQCLTGTSYHVFGEILVNGTLYSAGIVTDNSTNNIAVNIRTTTADAGGVVILGCYGLVSRVKPT